MAYQNYIVAVDKRRRRTSTDSDSLAVDALKVGGSGGQEISSSNVVVTDNSVILENKTIHGQSNTIQEIQGSSLSSDAKQTVLEHRKHAVWYSSIQFAITMRDTPTATT